MRLTAACPEAMLDDANQLAMVLAFGPPDELTYVGLNWKDAAGNLYAVASFDAQLDWMEGAQTELSRPEWDTADDGWTINLTGAKRAQTAMYLIQTDADGNAIDPLAKPDRLTVAFGEDGLAALAFMGLTPVEVPEQTAVAVL